MAITIDDLPVAFFSSHRNDAHRRAIVDGLCQIISDRQLPVTGFMIGENHAKQPALMRAWLEAGIDVGNHTWSHPNLKKIGLKAYLADLGRGHRAVAKIIGRDKGIPFRYPYLREGFDPEVRDAIRRHLESLGSPRAPVTVDTNDWYFARDYEAALRRGDRELAKRYVQPWRWNLEESVERAEWLSQELFDHEVPQILLLHANEINAHHLGSFLDWLEARGYQFIPLSEALADSAFGEPNESVSPTGDSLWLQLRRDSR
jgi:peptidoglycan/xylan/chitin deacetylase (PgdA/CDA1 family)